MTTTFNPQQLQAELGLDVGNDGPESSNFATISDGARNALSALLEHSARRLVERATTPSPDDKHLVRDTKVFVDCVLKLERTNRAEEWMMDGGRWTVGRQPGAAEGFARVTKRTRKLLSELLEHVLVSVALRAKDPTDDHIIRDTKIMLDCVVKIERLNRSAAERGSVDGGRWTEGKRPAFASQGRSMAEIAKDIVASDERFTERLRRQEGQRPAAQETAPEKEKQIEPERSTGVSPLFKREHHGQDAHATQNPCQERLAEYLSPPIPVALGKRNRHRQNAPAMKKH